MVYIGISYSVDFIWDFPMGKFQFDEAIGCLIYSKLLVGQLLTCSRLHVTETHHLSFLLSQNKQCRLRCNASPQMIRQGESRDYGKIGYETYDMVEPCRWNQ